MKDDIQTRRRNFLRNTLATGGAVAAATLLASRQTQAAEVLSTNDPAAKALRYVTDVTKIDVSKTPTFKAGSDCGNCALYVRAQAANGQAPCGAFANKLVPATGWCMAWAKGPTG
ncbi:MAG: high-potential iron-sulfur protein [Burkholderiaceae bacterium]|jgi:hypothetical protein|nr:high-potential iron-sulfur protein [Burkholderiaceae bacterium]